MSFEDSLRQIFAADGLIEQDGWIAGVEPGGSYEELASYHDENTSLGYLVEKFNNVIQWTVVDKREPLEWGRASSVEEAETAARASLDAMDEFEDDDDIGEYDPENPWR